ncbi:MurR/RpiR family transcriptional regulator, partial [Pseudogracilibacillus sp. SO30301A]|uniref:MurR/RpiR family transcriptional regulator n=1 Tax=Pseudogracilibacillus sp. SO30301A TaxID=3098291 RepID=UPI00300DF037
GFRSSLSVVYFMYYRLHRLYPNCELLMPESGNLPEKIMDLSADDLIIACTFSRYSKNVIDFIEDAKKQNAKVISFTDSYSSPVKTHSDILLPCLNDSTPFHNSVLSAIFVAEYLLQEIVIKYSNKVSDRLDKIESILSKKDSFYVK